MRNDKGSALLQGDEIKAAQSAFSLPDPRELNPLQMAYLGDTLHDLYVRSMLVSRKMSVGAMHKQAVRMVSAAAAIREPQMLPRPPSTTNTSTRMERLKLNFVAWREE